MYCYPLTTRPCTRNTLNSPRMSLEAVAWVEWWPWVWFLRKGRWLDWWMTMTIDRRWLKWWSLWSWWYFSCRHHPSFYLYCCSCCWISLSQLGVVCFNYSLRSINIGSPRLEGRRGFVAHSEPRPSPRPVRPANYTIHNQPQSNHH